MNILKRYFTRKTLKQHAIPFAIWHQVIKQIPILATLTNKDKTRLRLLTTLFLHKKSFTGARGLTITLDMKIMVAAQACLEILYLGLDSFDGWIEIIIYPAAFVVKRDVTDENGLVHQTQADGLSGESWGRGPLILSWEDVQRDSQCLHPGHNVVIHEFAHKLDMLTGRTNGLPPLHPEMPIQEWADTLNEAYTTLINRIDHHQQSYFNHYAATNPAEFFAVICEYFFTTPQTLKTHRPKVYQQLKSYFKQDPILAAERLNQITKQS